MVILDINGDGLSVERPKTGFIRVVDKYEFLNLFLVNLGPKQKANQTHIWTETDEVVVVFEKLVMGWAHERVIAWFMNHDEVPFWPVKGSNRGPGGRTTHPIKCTQLPFNLQ